MAAFDKLPPAARKALANAIENWAAQPLLTRYRRRVFKTGSEIAAVVLHADQKLLKRWEWQRRRAVGAYKGNAPETPAR